MRLPLAKRLVICTLNIVFPPLAVALLTGMTSPDTMLNCFLFLLAIIPSHIHGFYMSCVYFTRKRRARRGKWPGQPHKPGVWSERVLTGGVGWDEAERLKNGRGRKQDESDFESKRISRWGSGQSRSRSRSKNRRRDDGSKRSSQRYGNGQMAEVDRTTSWVQQQSQPVSPISQRV